MNSNVLQLLVGGRLLVEDKHRWTRGCLARTHDDIPCQPDDVFACKFCALGSLYHMAHKISVPKECVLDAAARLKQAAIKVLQEHGRNMSLVTVSNVNDYQGHEIVVEMFDRAIVLEKYANLSCEGESVCRDVHVRRRM